MSTIGHLLGFSKSKPKASGMPNAKHVNAALTE